MENVKVTVYLSTYNQAPYIVQALDSILMQKTTFPFEVLVADDCSSDDTQKIVLEYQQRFPDADPYELSVLLSQWGKDCQELEEIAENDVRELKVVNVGEYLETDIFGDRIAIKKQKLLKKWRVSGILLLVSEI